MRPCELTGGCICKGHSGSKTRPSQGSQQRFLGADLVTDVLEIGELRTTVFGKLAKYRLQCRQQRMSMKASCAATQRQRNSTGGGEACTKRNTPWHCPPFLSRWSQGYDQTSG